MRGTFVWDYEPGDLKKGRSMERKDNIVFVGLPGAGKSTLGVVLAKMAGYSFVDADLVIQELHGKTLQELIDELGAPGFIKLENEALKTIDETHCVISTGGSAIYSDEAIEHLKERGVVVFLRIPYDEMVRRLGDLDERGVVARDGKVTSLKALYDERMPLYEKHADLTFDVVQPSFRESAVELRDMLVEAGQLDG